ncbi:hypothetical protein [Psychrobacter sp. ANT_WB68]|uniref:hypothetical protein n=1 Tax=Psychrobacter sp. ANT_WB68 TaxID=2597355 RepID=UPI0011F33362|nr:hypothetical protein [Psychrobacter sp. ANT_WB68]KAA0913597.1 hypothetical protein FQ084_09890 [Psychrobacter sp. ANT_WB68]
MMSKSVSKLFPKSCLATVLGLGLGLSGCIATEKLVDYQLMRQEDAKWVADEQFTDIIIAVGKPAAPIQGVEHAIVFAGEKRSYLVQSINRDSEFIDILDQVDLAYFSFKPMASIDTPHFNIRIGEKGCTSTQGCIATTLWFEKPTHLLVASETAKLEGFDFTCNDGFAGGITRCTKSLWRLPVTVAPAVKNINTLSYRLHQPTTLNFYNYQPDKALAEEKRLKALMPLAKAFDIITFPIQFIMVEGIK